MLDVHVIDSANRHLYARELDEHHRIRHRIYVEEFHRRGLTPRADKREYDQFDMDDTVYLLGIEKGRHRPWNTSGADHRTAFDRRCVLSPRLRARSVRSLQVDKMFRLLLDDMTTETSHDAANIVRDILLDAQNLPRLMEIYYLAQEPGVLDILRGLSTLSDAGCQRLQAFALSRRRRHLRVHDQRPDAITLEWQDEPRPDVDR